MSNYKNYVSFALLLCLCILLGAVMLSRGGSTIAAWSENGQSDPMIIIDPGHGGEDGGAISVDGVPESRFNLEISLRLRDLIHFLGGRTKMLRTTDVSIYTEGTTIAQKKVSDIRNRVRLVEETPNAILVSIHQNHFSEEKYRGAQVFYAGTEGSEAIAKQLQAWLTQHLDERNHRQCKAAAGVYLLKHITCPAILVECGFLSNREEAQLLGQDSYQKKLAAVIACSILSPTEDTNEV